MAARSRPVTVTIAVIVLALLAGGCGVEVASGAGALSSGADDGVVGSDITPSEPTTPPTTAPAPPQVDIVGDDGSDLNRVAANAIADIEAWWTTEFPAVYGEPYQPVEGGFFAIDSSTDPDGLPCNPSDIDMVLDNAYYCPLDDGVVWDQKGLFPDLAKQYGDFAVAVVLAHEWGHAIQKRADFQALTLVSELQADCFAGAWVRHVRDDTDARFDISTGDLDLALAGILSLRDAPGSSADDPNAHGSGFDRVGAFQDGFEKTAQRCSEFTEGDPSAYQFPFSGADAETGGDLPYHGTDGDPGIDVLAFESLEKYWTDKFPEISGGKPWNPLNPAEGFDPATPPTCDGKPVSGFRLFYCVPDRYVGFDTVETMPDAYQLGDFAVGALFGTQYGLAVADQLGDVAPDEVTATLRGDCYSGAWAGDLLPTGEETPDTEFPYRLQLSPGDLDEAVTVLLSFRSDSDRERQGPGFDRVSAFRVGVTQGADACRTVKAPG